MRGLLVPVGILLCAGLVTLSAISRHLFLLQLLWAALGIGVVFFFKRVDWKSIFNYQWFIWGLYGLSVALLVAAFLAAPVIRNTKSWLVVGGWSFQPVELAKVALIVMYAQYFSRRHLAIARWKTILASFVLFFVPGVLTALQPDLGSASVLFSIWFGFLLVSGLPLRRLLVTLAVFALLGVVGWQSFLKDYQRERIRGVFYPEENALGINYSVSQSKIAIGSAGLWGKGYGQGSQTQLGFLTEPSNDFILAAVVEEWGMAAGIVVIAAFLFLVVRILSIGARADRNFEKFICLGAAITFSMHFILNAGSALGLVPVVGVTFPFLSYGGSALLTDFFLLAIISAIAERT